MGIAKPRGTHISCAHGQTYGGAATPGMATAPRLGDTAEGKHHRNAMFPFPGDQEQLTAFVREEEWMRSRMDEKMDEREERKIFVLLLPPKVNIGEARKICVI